ncbi:MAG: ABC transporter substrate-binding protein [Acetobacter sp.]|nr:ABC transporter substrate-binding protein [Acetobacter sp.]MBO6036572.1 ABC transporter substrate-binding protein [Acetobacter sp.]MBO6086318.1 ABC transporter substrate-binding protein [Acetobacter sp.]MBO7350306.1 ABC transporter substrate-binding protein [Acetobacter sp.]
MKAFSTRFMLILSLSLPPLLITYPTSQAVAQTANVSAIITPVQCLYTALKQVQNSHADFAQRSKIVAAAIDKSYDLNTLLKAAIGLLRYNALNADEKQKLLLTFRNFTVANYVSSFKPGSDARFTISQKITDSPIPGSKIVQTYIGSADSMPGTEVDYIVTNKNGTWKVTDVLLGDSHISQAAARHSDFRSTLASGGIPKLITVLQRKIENYSKE